jgi:hypothetical protein
MNMFTSFGGTQIAYAWLLLLDSPEVKAAILAGVGLRH